MKMEKSREDGLLTGMPCNSLPERWIDLAVALRCERTDTLWDWWKARYARCKCAEPGEPASTIQRT
jgi:hypothetical protein